VTVALAHAAKRRQLERILADDLTLRLYRNAHEPSDDDRVEDYDEATFAGYAPIVLRGGFWITDVLDGVGRAVYPERRFRATVDQAEQAIVGYFVTETDGALAWAERFADGPYPVEIRGDMIHVTPRYALRRAA
jgi:hypothetical protein